MSYFSENLTRSFPSLKISQPSKFVQNETILIQNQNPVQFSLDFFFCGPYGNAVGWIFLCHLKPFLLVYVRDK